MNVMLYGWAELWFLILFIREIMITYIVPNVTLEDFLAEMREICHFQPDQRFTMKWVDEEGEENFFEPVFCLHSEKFIYF